MLQSTMINPLHDARTQVDSSNTTTGNLPPLDITRYMERKEQARLGYMYDHAATEEKNQILIDAVKPIIMTALVTEHHLDPAQVEDLVTQLFTSPRLHPDTVLHEGTINHVEKYFQHAYDEVRLATFTACMQRYQKIHRLYVPVEKLDYFSIDDILAELRNPDCSVTKEDAKEVFQRDPMMSFTIMYAMSSHQIFETVHIPEFRSMMLPMSYQLWKKEILEPSEPVESGAVVEPAAAKVAVKSR